MRKLRELFKDNPDDLKLLSRGDENRWADDIEAFMDLDLVPASDPNTPARIARIMQSWALMMVAQQNPGMYDMREVNDRVLTTLQVAAPETLLTGAGQAPPPGPPPMPPPDPSKMAAVQQKAQSDDRAAQLKEAELQLKAHGQQSDQALKQGEAQQSAAGNAQDRQAKAQEFALQSADQAADRQASDQAHQVSLATEQIQLQIAQEKLAAAQANRAQKQDEDQGPMGQPVP